MNCKFFSAFLLASTLTICSASDTKVSVEESGKDERVNPICSYFITKGKNIPEGGFFDPNSNDLDNAFTSFIVNTHPLYKNPEIPYKMLTIGGLSTNPLIVDTETLENCVMIDTHWTSNGLNRESMEPLLKAFWEGKGMFDYLEFNEKKQEWVESKLKPEIIEIIDESEKEEEEEDSITENEEKKTKTVKKKSKKNKKKKKKANNKNQKQKGPVAKPKLMPVIMNPKMKLIRSTLVNPHCQRAMVAALSVLSAEQVAIIFRNSPIEILDNPEILSNITDFSAFIDKESVAKLSEIMGNKFHRISIEMIKSLPIKALFKIFEVRNFDVSKEELHDLLMNRPDFAAKEPFASDHRTFRIFCTDNSFFPNTIPELILDAIESSGLTSNVVESILAFYVRGEFGVQVILNHLHKNGFENELPLRDLENIFIVRNRVISAVEPFDLILLTLLKTPLNGFIRSVKGNEAHSSTLNEVKKRLNCTLPYEDEPMTEAAQVFTLWKEVNLVTCEKFITGRWTRNFLRILISELEEAGNENFLSEANEILRRHVYPRFNLFGRFDWFLLPIKDVISTVAVNLESLEISARISMGYGIARKLKAIFSNVDLRVDGIIEAIWRNPDAMTALLTFPSILDQDHVDALVGSEVGRELLKENPSLLQSLPTYGNFTLEDMNRLNLSLDDFAVSIGTLKVETARAWLEQNEGLVNSSTRALLRPHVTVATEMISWPMINFHTFRADYGTIQEFEWIEFLEISRYIDQIPNINDKLSLIARWLVHMETQCTWLWHLCRLPNFNTDQMNVGREAIILSSVESSETTKFITYLVEELKENCQITSEDREKIAKLILILTKGKISAIKTHFTLTSKHISEETKPSKDQAREMLQNDNDFIIKLIQDGSGSEKFKRVWTHRAKLLVLNDIEMMTTKPFEGMEAADQGMIPLDDVLLQWFILNRVTIERYKIKADLRRIQVLPVEPIPSDVPHADWFKVILDF